MKFPILRHSLFFLLLSLFPLASIASSSSYGIYNNLNTLFNAENIYWPATTTGALSTGSYHATTNPLGNGARVASTYADKVDYTPWIIPISGTITTNTTLV